MPDHRPEPQLRWHTETVERSPIFVVPGDSSGSGTLKPMGKTWGMRVSGDVDKLVPHEYCCPVHGRFTVQVKASDVPDERECPHSEPGTLPAYSRTEVWLDSDGSEQHRVRPGLRNFIACRRASPWAGSSCAIGIEPGMVTG